MSLKITLCCSFIFTKMTRILKEPAGNPTVKTDHSNFKVEFFIIHESLFTIK